MRKAFREAYNRELAILKERSREFAADFPGLADRLGGLLDDNLDPAVAGLLEGTAFLAARVQVNIEEQFRVFTQEMLNQVFPDALAPTPSVMLAEATPPFDNDDLVTGMSFARGEYLDARFTDADKRISCRFRLTAPLTMWPFKITAAKYHKSAGPLNALGRDVSKGTKAGLVIDFNRVTSTGRPSKKDPFSDLTVDEFPVYLTAPLAQAVALYEQIHCGALRASLRYKDKNGDPVFRTLPPDAIEQIGFEDDTYLFPHDGRLFHGFALLREALVFPNKFLGFRVTGLRTMLAGIKAPLVQLVFEFGRANQKLAAQFEPEHLRLFAAPAVNLFDEFSSQVRLDGRRHEYVVTPDSSPATHYEIFRIKSVFAHYAGNQEKEEVFPLYAPPPDGKNPHNTLYYTSHRKPRRLTASERRQGGTRFRYRGTETFISIYEPPDAEPAQRLQMRLECSNRHLTEYLPIAQSKDDFYMSEDQSVTLNCIAGPTPPMESMLELESDAAHRLTAGDNYWRLLSYLSLNHFGLENRNSEDGAAAMREVLNLFADPSSVVNEAQVRGLRQVETRPAIRTIRRADGYHAARGLEVTLTFDEDEYEGSGIMLLGAVVDRFIAEYAAVNSFTQCVIRSMQRGEVMTFPPRSGRGPLL